MNAFTRYTEFRTSNIEWLGDLPNHWKTIRLKFLCWRSAVYGANESANSYLQDGVRFIRTSDIDDNGNLLDEGGVYLERDKVRDYLLQDGDILLSRSGTIGRAFLYSRAIHGECAYAGYLVRFSLKKEHLPKLLFYFTKSKSFQDWLSVSIIQSTIGNVNGQKYANLPVPIPSRPEQAAIVAFLNAETQRIDSLLAAKQDLIDLLGRKRISLISHAVTKGLNSRIGRRESNIPWLGSIPMHWEIRSLNTVAPLQRGHDLTNAQKVEGSVPVISSSGFSGYHNVAKVKGPGVITGRYGTIGQIYYVEEDFWPMNTSLYVYDFKGNHPRYIYYLLWVLPFGAFSGKSAVPGVDRNDLNPLKVVCPPRDEQIAIAEFLDRETKKIDELVLCIKDSHTLLSDLRTSLISAAVTGKIDVRNLLQPA